MSQGGPGFPFSTETLEGDKIGCIYSVMIKMADLTNKRGTTEDRRQNYRGNNPQSVKLSNLRFSVKVSPVWVLLGECAKTIIFDTIWRH